MKCFVLYLETDGVNNRIDNLTLVIKNRDDQHNATLLHVVEKLKRHNADQLELLKQNIGKCNNSFLSKNQTIVQAVQTISKAANFPLRNSS